MRGGDLPQRKSDLTQGRFRVDAAERSQEAIAGLRPTLRSAITLRHVQGLRYEEIAEILEIPLGTVKVRIFRARAAMAEVCKARMVAFGQAGNASKIKPINLEEMYKRYESGELDPTVK